MATARHSAPVTMDECMKQTDLFDFGHYQQLFAKQYGSQLEAVTRRAYFLANALQAYTSGVAYKFWKQSYYRALNEFSDWSPNEVDKMENRDAPEDGVPAPSSSDKPVVADTANEQVESPEEVVEELEAEIAQAFEREPAFGRLLSDDEEDATSGHHRQKRHASAGGRPPRSLTIDKLIKTEQTPAAGSKRKLVREQRNPASNNPHYDSLALEPMTRGLVDQQEPVEIWSWNRGMVGAIGATVSGAISKWFSFGKFGASNQRANDDPVGSSKWKSDLPDEMFIDLRESGCMFEPRSQGKCGSCYAFVGIAMMEYHYCKKTNQRVAFSEQYMLDCGKNRVDRMNGCGGAGGWSVPTFIHNFGLELRNRYPYVGRELDCPYREDMDLRAAGFIRMDIKHVTRIHSDHWPRLLKHGPLFVTMATGGDFHQYGGGVYDGRRCPKKAGHAMLVVGYGRQDGQEFWLLRNSHGTRWGEAGYMKFSRDAPKRCIEFQQGYAWGTKDGETFVDPQLNEHNPVLDLTSRPTSKNWSILSQR